MESLGSPLLWVGFTGFVLVMLALDLGVFHRQAHAVGWREALGWSIFWITLALVFNLGIYLYAGAQPALEFLAGYLIEKSLSVDNIFVFLVIFSYFAVPAAYQHRVLFYGILGALIMRAVFILLGAAMLEAFHWTIYVFGAILLITAVKLLVHRHEEVHPERNPVVRLFKRFVPLAVTRDPFIVYTSNIFAILGLRALFFLLAGAIGKLYYLKTGLAIVLGFVGVKMVIADWYKIPITVSLAIIAACIGGAALASLLRSPPAIVLASEEARDRDFAVKETR
jgi:tellurite resistance protein TerC